MGDILSDYTVIRELLGVTTEQLPDATIEADEILGYAEIQVKAAVPTWADLTGADRVRMQTAVCALVAAQLVVPTLAGELTAVQLADWRYEVNTGGQGVPQERHEELLKLAREALAGISTRTLTATAPLVLAGLTRKAAAS